MRDHDVDLELLYYAPRFQRFASQLQSSLPILWLPDEESGWLISSLKTPLNIFEMVTIHSSIPCFCPIQVKIRRLFYIIFWNLYR